MAYYLGFDVGGTKCAISVGEVDNTGGIAILERYETLTETSPQATFDKLSWKIKAYQKRYKIVGAGISCGGPLNTQTGVIVSPPNLVGWHGFAIVKYVKERYGIIAKLENDANACALAEWKFGAGKGCKNMAFFTFGTGLGAGLILDGKLYQGTNGNAGEAGHIRLAPRGPIGYNKKGSFEGFCSGGGIARLAKQMARRLKDPPKYMDGDITTKELAKKAFDGDEFAKKVFAKSGDMLGQGLSILVDILNPEKIVLGGVFMRSAELLLPTMQRRMKKECLSASLSVCQIVKAELSENIGDFAALAIATEM